MINFDYSGKTVLVSGGSRGIGREIALQFAAAGAKVAVHYNQNQAAAEQTLSDLEGAGHILVQAELSDPNSIQAMVDTVTRAFNRIDVLINNAGIFEEHKVSVVSYEEWQAAWERTIAVNLMGPANLTYCCFQQMRNQGYGRIVNVSSRGAFRGEPDCPAYGASKAGLNAMGQSLAQAMAPYNVFVHTIAPGFVETEMATEVLEGPDGDGVRNQSPFGRVAQPEEIAQMALILASGGTEFSTGAIVDVNGASYLRS